METKDRRSGGKDTALDAFLRIGQLFEEEVASFRRAEIVLDLRRHHPTPSQLEGVLAKELVVSASVQLVPKILGQVADPIAEILDASQNGLVGFLLPLLLVVNAETINMIHGAPLLEMGAVAPTPQEIRRPPGSAKPASWLGQT